MKKELKFAGHSLKYSLLF